jgi:hypothetical protein
MVMVFTRYVIVDVADFVRLELGLALDRQYDGGEIDDCMDVFILVNNPVLNHKKLL